MRSSEFITEAVKQRLDAKCWKGKHKEGTKIKGGVRVNNCVPNESVEENISEIGFSSSVGKLQLSDKQLIDSSTVDGTIGTSEVHLFVDGSNRIYFFADGSKIKALLYLTDDRLMAMKNFSENSGLIYNLFQYVVNIKKQKIRLTPIDKLTPDGIEWVIGQLSRANGFKITDRNGDKIDPDMLYDEWESARNTGEHGPTEIIIRESSYGKQIRENENRLMPMDIFGSTLIQLSSKNNVPELFESAAWQRKEGKNKKGGLNAKGVASYRKENPGSKLQTAVTTKPSKLKAGSKDAKRRKSFCARMSGMKGPMKKPNGDPTRKALALRKWHCESVEHFVEMFCENMDHSKDNQAVPELKAALIARKEKLQSATEDQVYDIIDQIMTRIAKSHGMSGQTLHDMWVKEYDQIPDTWIMKESVVTELFAPGKDWKWDYNSGTEAEATFVVGDIQYKFYAFRNPGSKNAWEAEFKIVEGGDPGNRFGITGTGNAAQVMSTITDIMRAFLDKYKDKIDSLVFSAKESSRRALYARMTKRLMPNWKLTQVGADFVLTAPKAA